MAKSEKALRRELDNEALRHRLATPVQPYAAQQPQIVYVQPPQVAQAPQRSDSGAGWAFLAVFMLLIAAAIGGVLWVGPENVMARLLPPVAQATAVPTAQPMATRVPSGGNVAGNSGGVVIVQPTAIVPAPDNVQPAQAVINADAPVVAPVAAPQPTAKPFDGAAILAQGRGPIATTPEPTPNVTQRIMPAFAPYLPNGGADVKPTSKPVDMFNWK